VTFQHRGIGLERAARRIVDDGAALQYHNTVGQPQNLLRILLDNDGADTTRAGNRAQRPQQLLDDDGRQPLGRLVQEQNLRVERQRPADGQHLLLAAGKLVAVIASPFLEARKHLVDPLNRPRPRLGNGRHVLLDRQRAKDIALLRHPADPCSRPLVRPEARDVLATEPERAAKAACDTDDGIDQRRLAGTVAPQQRQHLALRQAERHAWQHDRLAITGAQVLDGEQLRHRCPRRDRPP